MNEFDLPYSNNDFSGLSANQVDNAQLGIIFEAAPVCIVSYRAIRNRTNDIIDFKPLRLNQRAVTACGYSREAIMKSTLLTLFPQLQDSALLTQYRTVILSGKNHRNDYFIPPFGGWFDVAVSRTAPDELAAIFIDINERKQTELQMQQQAELLTQISQSMQMAVSSHLPVRNEQGQIVDFRYTYFNEKAREWLPVDWRDAVGQTIRTMQFSTNVDQTIARMARVVDTGEPTHFDAITTDGHVYYNLIARSGEGTVATFMDVTEQRRSEHHMLELKTVSEQQTALLQSILDASQTALACYEVVRNKQGAIIDFRFILANQTTFSILETTAEELYGKTICEINPTLLGSAVLDQYVNVYETDQSVTIERQARERYYYVSIVKFGDGVLTSAIDITENRHYQEQLEVANVALRQSNENLQSFAYVASHDLQEPLRKIKSFGDLLLNEYSPQLPERGQDMLRRMQSAAERMSNLIRDLLALSRLTTTKRPFAPVDLNYLLTDILGDLETAIIDTGAILEISTLPIVFGDILQLRQLVQNLLSNALKFRQPERSPHIRIDSGRVNKRDIPIGLLAGMESGPHVSNIPADSMPVADSDLLKPYYVLTISDNGIGFDAAKYGEMIFGAFQRLHGRGGDFVGTGIGLAIAKKVVENHQGAIAVQSQEGEGASFTVYLPIRS